MSQNNDINIHPKIDPAFLNEFQVALNKKPLQIKVALDPKSLDSIQKKLPDIKIKFENQDLDHTSESIKKSAEAASAAFNDNLSALSSLMGSNQIVAVALESMQLMTSNIVAKGAENASNNSPKEKESYNSVTNRVEELNGSFANLGTQKNDVALVNGFLNIANAIMNVVDKVGMLKTALAGISILGAVKGVG